MDAATVLKGIPFGHCKDMIETLKPFYMACDETETMLALLTATVSNLIIHKDGMQNWADTNYCTATELSDELVKTEGISFRVAYQIVGSIIGNCIEGGLNCQHITTEMLDRAGMLFAGRAFDWPQERVSRVLDSAYSVENKECDGAPGPLSSDRMFSHLEEKLNENEKTYRSLLDCLEKADLFLRDQIKCSR